MNASKRNHPDYGYGGVHASFPGVNHKKVQRLIKTLGLQVRSRKSKKFTTYRGTIDHIGGNGLEGDFSATGLKQNWVTDIIDSNMKESSKSSFIPSISSYKATR
ncbi:UDP-N-acetylglucosamine 1-carboxyvinyltransferase [Haemophilus influenzae 3655]|uniref:UDP-N-acetylglucosamine 1-carboxyvinyltransferase n=1 Tax=Haemophilus influenzae (strain NTHi 3655) TaxID=375177 RepID=A0A0H3PK02_HAEI3|nr:hypothetical protein [Haemophilus influenzae]EDJ93897.1 UDP-N-acetylglucosamine 1-carboxyvinyltransferase [Haemophilus influenzae 3655]